jgi:DNA repair protein RecN (Recombination protein N)
MPHTWFDIAFSATPAPTDTSDFLKDGDTLISETGAEQACFMIAPNVGEDLKPLSRIASGGELSRVVLALKSILAADASSGTMIFDEVDAGIGGEVALEVGKKLSRLAAASQVICITHLAQIAAFGDHHYQISKHVEQNRTFTRITPLDPDQRLLETARMLAGDDISFATRTHAAEMINKAGIYRKSLLN